MCTHARPPARSAHASVGLPHHFALSLGLGLDDDLSSLSFILVATPPAVPTAGSQDIRDDGSAQDKTSCCVGADRKSTRAKTRQKISRSLRRSSRPTPASWRPPQCAEGLSFRLPVQFHRMIEATKLSQWSPFDAFSSIRGKIAPPGETNPLAPSRRQPQRASREARHNRPDFPKSRRLPQTAGRFVNGKWKIVGAFAS